MANNERKPNTKKRGRHANKLIVEIFLLDPNCQITKLTKETCSPKAVRQLMQNGYGPPRPGNECILENNKGLIKLNCWK